MAIPVYLWLKDDGGKEIKGGVSITGREGSVEVLELKHQIEIATDDSSGAITGRCVHKSVCFAKQIDPSTVYLNEAVTEGKTLKEARFVFYKITEAGAEQEYYSITLEGVKVASVGVSVENFKNASAHKKLHEDWVELRYDKVTWYYMDGNLKHSNSWNERS